MLVDCQTLPPACFALSQVWCLSIPATQAHLGRKNACIAHQRIKRLLQGVHGRAKGSRSVSRAEVACDATQLRLWVASLRVQSMGSV